MSTTPVRTDTPTSCTCVANRPRFGAPRCPFCRAGRLKRPDGHMPSGSADARRHANPSALPPRHPGQHRDVILSPYFVDGSVYVSPTHLFIGTGPDPAAEPDPVWQLEVARREARHAIRQGFAERTLDGMTISILAWLGETATPPSLTKGEDIYRRIAGKAT